MQVFQINSLVIDGFMDQMDRQRSREIDTIYMDRQIDRQIDRERERQREREREKIRKKDKNTE